MHFLISKIYTAYYALESIEIPFSEISKTFQMCCCTTLLNIILLSDWVSKIF